MTDGLICIGSVGGTTAGRWPAVADPAEQPLEKLAKRHRYIIIGFIGAAARPGMVTLNPCRPYTFTGKHAMSDEKVISIESLDGPSYMMLQNVMRMVPDRDQQDVALQRLLAFRLRIDGESATREYLMRKIRDMIQCRYSGRLYDFLKDDHLSSSCAPTPKPTDPPDTA